MAADGSMALTRLGEPPGEYPSGEVLARVRGVAKRYGRTVALRGLDLDIRRGETLGLLGPNGAGKTTLMHVLSGVIRPDEGEVMLGDAGAPANRRARRHIGLAPQALSLYPQLTAAENLRFFARIHGVPRARLEQRVRFGLQLADLSRRADDPAGNFSGGMQRRLNLACAVLHEPRLLLLDEPTAGVDPQSRQHLYDAIAALHAQGLTILISTHLIDEAERLCDRVAIVDGGRLRDQGTPQELCVRAGEADLQGALLSLTGRELRD
jgi:ABC-2 type transport system ATP-binding protein